MKDSATDLLIKNVDYMEFGFPMRSTGHGVDKITGQGNAPEKVSDEEGVNVVIHFYNKHGRRVLVGDEAMKIYEIVWHFLNKPESGVPEL